MAKSDCSPWKRLLSSLVLGQYQGTWISGRSPPPLTVKRGSSCLCCSVTQSYPTLCDPMDWITPGFPVLHYLPESVQTHVPWVGDASTLNLCIKKCSLCYKYLLFFLGSGTGICARLEVSVWSAPILTLSDQYPMNFSGWHHFTCVVTTDGWGRLSTSWEMTLGSLLLISSMLSPKLLFCLLILLCTLWL